MEQEERDEEVACEILVRERDDAPKAPLGIVVGFFGAVRTRPTVEDQEILR